MHKRRRQIWRYPYYTQAALFLLQWTAQALLGNRVGLAEFGSEGYNSQGGGPVADGEALSCNFEGEPCCWANIPTPSDDQIDWYLVQGTPESVHLRNISMKGRYLFAYAKGAGPSDEAQLSSCAITCASSPIKVRARHWQSSNVLLQVCQRESFPATLGFNPLLNCQEFPSPGHVAYTELALPKASYVDIVFVASNFIDEITGDIAFLDDIEILYERRPPDCVSPPTQTTTQKIAIKSTKTIKTTTENLITTPIIPLNEGTENERNLEGTEISKQEISENENTVPKESAAGSAASSSVVLVSEKVEEGILPVGGEQKPVPLAQGENNAKAHGVIAKSGDEIVVLPPTQSPSINSEICQSIKCSFEDEGSFYAAVFLYPREKAGLWTNIGNSENNINSLLEPTRIRFQFYEGTHGVQLKGCCALNSVITGNETEDGNLDCPFLSDKFVSVSDRMWKWGTFVCPKGTKRGACALDDIAIVENREDINMNDRP
uniref:MAM domain-containing protein n=1 Tax=Meloidogyne hapla TaxID=6305 RepID=A0A1I8BX35_MELHA